jgi:mRNA-degrading endonuclease toxin of MazEF toxin-antitoxin module
MKDYKNWTLVKTKLHNNESAPVSYREGEIWACRLGENIGAEQDGVGKDFTRPVLILKIFNRSFCHIVPLSTTGKRDKFHYAFDGGTGKTSVAVLSQSRSISSFRLQYKGGEASKQDFNAIKARLQEVLGLYMF